MIPSAIVLLTLLAATPAENGAVFDRAWALAGRKFHDPALNGIDWDAARARHRPAALAARDEAALYGAVNALLATLGDSHTFAVPPSSRARGGAGDDGPAGFGLDIAPGPDGWRIERLAADGPAARAGIQIGWRLLAIDGRPPDGARSFGAGDRAVLRLADDDGRAREFALVGEALPEEPPRRATRLAGGVLLLAFQGFEGRVDRWLRDEIAAARPAGVIIDLRGNDGGDSATLDRAAGLFFAEPRTVLRLMRRRETEERTIGAGAGAYPGPLAVLIGPASASAAEAFAALIDESGRGVTVGQRSAGALTGASHFRLPDGGELSVAEWDVRTGGGRRLEGAGLAPRVTVTPTVAERRWGEDPAIDCARRLVLALECAARGEKTNLYGR